MPDPAVSAPEPVLAGDGPRDACGVFALYAPGEHAATLIYYGLYALQHRGQESAGIAASDGAHVLVTKEMGLVNQAFDHAKLAGLDGHLGIGHVRYSTTGASTWENAQPAFQVTPSGGGLALGHNGNLVNTAALSRSLGPNGEKCTTDSEVLAELFAQEMGEAGGTGRGGLEQAIAATVPRLSGAYSLVAMDERAIYGVRDPHGIRPLVIGRMPAGGLVLASETGALDIVGAHRLRDVAPGELVVVDEGGLRTRRVASASPRFCAFEYVYLARPDHRTDETTVAAARREMGRLLARSAPAEADLVVPVPDSGVSAAAGYAQESGIPYAEGLVKNRYVGRTFIEPSQTLRQLGIRLKLNPLRDVLEGQRLVVVDDSIVRGNTSQQLVRMLRESGAAEVHLRISAPPIRHPCYYGIDMATRAELIASGLTTDEIRDFVGADSLAYLPLEGLEAGSGLPMASLCRACFDGQYPVPVPGDTVTGSEPTLFSLDEP
jgi:amidophosphoribosyltransferase